MRLGYNTNGLAHHRFDEACRMLADLGYRAVALTPDTCHLDPYRTAERDWDEARRLLDSLGLAVGIETGARYVIDPRRKHWPTLLSARAEDGDRRLDFYRRCLRMAKALGAPWISIWSGPLEPGDAPEAAWSRLLDRLPRLLDEAGREGVQVCFEPEPGMLVDSLAAYRELRRRLGRADLMTTIDVGHLVVTEAGPAEAHLAEWAPTLRNVQLDDARRGVHEHLPPGQGEIDFAAVFAELRRIGYAGIAALELSRDGHRGAQAAAAAIDTLGRMIR